MGTTEEDLIDLEDEGQIHTMVETWTEACPCQEDRIFIWGGVLICT